MIVNSSESIAYLLPNIRTHFPNIRTHFKINPTCSKFVTPFILSTLPGLSGLQHHHPLEPILSAQSVESSQENSIKQLDTSSDGERYDLAPNLY